MLRYRSAALAVAAIAVLAVAFVALRPGEEEEAPTPGPTASPAPPTTAETQPDPAAVSADPEPEPQPPAPLLEPDSTQDIQVDQGETVRFRVRSPQDDEIHVHGYDRTKQVGAGETVSMSFPADIEGIFEIELEESGMPLGELRVDP